jgi:hypothetical protein
MSSTAYRPPLRGLIYQGDSIVGGVDLNGVDEPFIDQFNREYARLGLRVEPQAVSQSPAGVSNDEQLVAAAS